VSIWYSSWRLTEVRLLDDVLDLLCALRVRNHDCRCSRVQRCGKDELVALWYADDDHGLALGVVLCRVDDAVEKFISTLPRQQKAGYSLV
jgi:hypothetical protein